MTETMQAVRLRGPGVLALEEIARPEPAEGEALVRVHAAAITRDELDWPLDRLPAIPSYELSGVVAAVGEGVTAVAAGDPVWALTPFDRDGVAAEYAAVPAAVLAPKPASLSHVESAAVPLPALSAWQGLFDHGGLEAGQRVLVHGAAGGVGHFAVQLAAAQGAHVAATCSPASAELVRAVGAEEVLGYGSLPSEPVDLVFDTAGGAALAGSPRALRPGGRIVSIAEEPPEDVEAVYFIVEPSREALGELAAMADAGKLTPAIDAVFALAEAQAAFARSMEHGKRGKVVLGVLGD
jgi:NADPH:quinone reductase-like Zn-dependent oxidoreductase